MKRTRTEKVRLTVIFALVCGFFAVVAARLVHLQLVMHPRYSEIVDRQSSTTVEIPPERGMIYDRYGRVVANNVKRASLYAYPISDRELGGVAGYIENLYRLKPGTAAKRYGLRVRRFRWIDRHIDDKLAVHIEATAPSGLHLRDETQRTYPYGLVGKQILGFTDIDNNGQSGLELAWDSLMAGRKGQADIRRDGLRNLYRVKEQALVKPQPGQSVVLTIDWCLQEIVEEELRHGVREFGAQAAMAAFMDCNTGELLAVAHYDPEEKYPDKPFKLRPLADMFEPGSIFKAVTAAALLDAEVVDYEDSVFCEEGKWKLDGRTLHDDKELEWLSFREIMELSSNIGIAKYAIDLGGDELYEAAERFGFGQKVGLGLPGETGGTVFKPAKWSDYTIASLAMGHAIGVNCIQMVDAFAAVANGGKLVQPHLVLCSVNEENNVVHRAEPKVIRRVLTDEASDSLSAILRGVVERGTATKVNSEAVTIAGKTGTAQMIDPETGRYSWREYVASFAGFFPADDPTVVGIVVMIDPQPIHYGGYTSGPVFRRVAERYTILNPDLFENEDRIVAQRETRDDGTVEVPHLIGRSLVQARWDAMEHGVDVRCNRDSGVVVWQYPPADRLILRGDEIVVAVESPVEPGVRMADLKGLSIREASAFLQFAGIKSRIKGRGKVINQSIKPGEPVTRETVCRLECRPI